MRRLLAAALGCLLLAPAAGAQVPSIDYVDVEVTVVVDDALGNAHIEVTVNGALYTPGGFTFAEAARTTSWYEPAGADTDMVRLAFGTPSGGLVPFTASYSAPYAYGWWLFTVDIEYDGPGVNDWLHWETDYFVR